MSEQEASDYHRDHDSSHYDSRCGAVLDKAVYEEEYKVEYYDLYDVPHVSVDERPARQDIQELHRIELLTADACCNHKCQYACIERYEYGDKALLEEPLKVVLFCLEAGIQTVAGEEEEHTDEEDTEFREEFKSTGTLHQFLCEVVDDDRHCGKALDSLGALEAQRLFLPLVYLGYLGTEQEDQDQCDEDYERWEFK